MATPRQHKRPYTLDIAENLNECVANLAKSVEIVKNINQNVAEGASVLRKQSEVLKIRKTHEFTTVGSADIIRTRIEQFIQPTITSIINQYNANLDRVNDEIADLTEQVKEQKRQINLLATSTRMDFDQDKEEEDALMEKRIRDRNNKLKQELELLDNDIVQLNYTSSQLTVEINEAQERRKHMKPNLSKIMKTKADLVEGKRKLVETENEWKEKLQETRDAVDSEMTDVHDNTRGQHSAHGFTANKYDFIQDVVSKINDPAFVASKSNITECIHQARQFKETLPKKENYINVDASNPEAVDAWLNKKSHQLSTAISLDTKQQKTTAQVVELLVTNAVVPLADLQREYPIEKEDQHGLSKILYFLVRAGTIRVEGSDIMLKE